MTEAQSLIRLLRSEDAAERILALESLVREHPDEAPQHVREALGDSDPRVRVAALRGARALAVSLTLEDLREVLEDVHEEVRVRSVQALPSLDPEHALELMTMRLQEEDSPKVLATLVRLLSGLGSPEHYSLLAPFLRHPDARVRANAVEAIDTLLRRSLLAPLEELGGDASNRVRGNVAVVLSRFDGAAAAQVLEGMVGHTDKWFRVSAAWAAGTSGHPALLEAILPLLRDPEPDVQLMAIKALREMPRVDALLAELEQIAVNEADPAVSHYARRALESLRPTADE